MRPRQAVLGEGAFSRSFAFVDAKNKRRGKQGFLQAGASGYKSKHISFYSETIKGRILWYLVNM